jgi:hypothetical protein
MCRVEEFDDPKQFPNIAVVRFAKEHENLRRDIKRLELDRSILDIPTLILPCNRTAADREQHARAFIGKEFIESVSRNEDIDPNMPIIGGKAWVFACPRING